MKSRVDEFASRCCPDFVYRDSSPRGLTFRTTQIDPDLDTGKTVGMVMEDQDGKPFVHLFTRWSRSQLLSHLGTREKWFDTVSLETQETELNARRHTFDGHMFRTMRSYVGDVRIVRGFVSEKYGDIPDTRIMDSLVDLLPDGWAVKGMSGKTDRAMYVYAITRNEVHIPGTQFRAFPGVVVKNSEVGFTSLWVFPMLYVPKIGSAAVTEDHEVRLRRVHRGTAKDLEKDLKEVLDDMSALWGSIESRLMHLRAILYATEDDAVAAMRSVLLSSKASKLFAWRCEQAYKSAKHAHHTGFTVFETVLARVQKELDRDDAYTQAALAGAVLLKLKD